METDVKAEPFDAADHEEQLREAISDAISKYQEFVGSNRNYAELLEPAADLVGSNVSCEEMAVTHRMDDGERYSHIRPFITQGQCIERKLKALISKHRQREMRP